MNGYGFGVRILHGLGKARVESALDLTGSDWTCVTHILTLARTIARTATLCLTAAPPRSKSMYMLNPQKQKSWKCGNVIETRSRNRS